MQLCALSQADDIEIAVWQANYRTDKTGIKYIQVKAKIDSDWYIYGIKNDKSGPIPLTFTLENKNIKILRIEEVNPAVKFFDEIFGKDVYKNENEAVFRIYVSTTKEIETVKINIEGQACNKKNGICMLISENILVK